MGCQFYLYVQIYRQPPKDGYNLRRKNHSLNFIFWGFKPTYLFSFLEVRNKFKKFYSIFIKIKFGRWTPTYTSYCSLNTVLKVEKKLSKKLYDIIKKRYFVLMYIPTCFFLLPTFTLFFFLVIYFYSTVLLLTNFTNWLFRDRKYLCLIESFCDRFQSFRHF